MMAVNLISLTNCQYTEYSLAENKWTSPPLPQCVHLSIRCIILTLHACQNFETGINDRDRKHWTLRKGGGGAPFHTLLFFCKENRDGCLCIFDSCTSGMENVFLPGVKHHKLLTNKWCQPPSLLMVASMRYLLLLLHVFTQLFSSALVCGCFDRDTSDRRLLKSDFIYGV